MFVWGGPPAIGQAQSLYFPPNNSAVWDTMPPAALGWCQTRIDSLYALLDSNDTKAFVLLKDGKAFVQSGGGVVADSTPEGEYQETVNKAMAGMRAIDRARKTKWKLTTEDTEITEEDQMARLHSLREWGGAKR